MIETAHCRSAEADGDAGGPEGGNRGESDHRHHADRGEELTDQAPSAPRSCFALGTVRVWQDARGLALDRGPVERAACNARLISVSDARHGNPTTRTPFNQRAAGHSCAEGKVAWDDLVRCEKARQANEFYTTEVAGSLWLGAQAVNAESIPFRGRAEQNVLLHFWPHTALIFVPQRINNDGESEFVGYCLAIPEVADLELFCEDYPKLLHDLSQEVRGFRPTEAVIDLPAQAALEFMEHLARLTAFKAEKKRTGDSVSSVEYLHLVKIGNNVKSLAAGQRRAEEKSGHTWESFKDKKIKDEKTGKERIAVPEAYREAKEKVASGIFLEMRSRREQDFVDHFTATFCSVRQYLPEDDFRLVAEALLTKSEDVKTLTLLALSANS